ncbi:MAG: hypothetical protein Q4D02_05655 [Clostridia bacterium]|nr:hypothetical protein [Clostridia bacterium]
MADIVVSSKKKINLFDRVIQSVVIMVNMNKMNKAIDEHLSVIRKTEGDDKKVEQENILREIVFVKYQYDIMQREMYELKISYPEEITNKINSTDKTERFELQKAFLEMEYDRITRAKFKSKEDIKFNLLSISSAIEAVKQDIKDEGKAQRYNKVIKTAEDIDIKIQTEEYTEECYKELFEAIDEYVGYINDNYDISKLPSDERELIEYVIETMIKGIESDIDKHMYEYNLIINISKNAYRYFKIIDKIFEKLQKIYDESLDKGIMNLKDYMKLYGEIYEMMIKTKVNDVHRTIKTEDEYLEYSKLLANSEEEKVEIFLYERALESTSVEGVKKILNIALGNEVNEEEEPEETINVEAIKIEEVKVEKVKETKEEKKARKAKEKEEKKAKRKVGRPRKEEKVEEVKVKRRVGRPRKDEKV